MVVLQYILILSNINAIGFFGVQLVAAILVATWVVAPALLVFGLVDFLVPLILCVSMCRLFSLVLGCFCVLMCVASVVLSANHCLCCEAFLPNYSIDRAPFREWYICTRKHQNLFQSEHSRKKTQNNWCMFLGDWVPPAEPRPSATWCDHLWALAPKPSRGKRCEECPSSFWDAFLTPICFFLGLCNPFILGVYWGAIYQGRRVLSALVSAASSWYLSRVGAMRTESR